MQVRMSEAPTLLRLPEEERRQVWMRPLAAQSETETIGRD